jgi:methyl-accepting chemotaxis protein
LKSKGLQRKKSHEAHSRPRRAREVSSNISGVSQAASEAAAASGQVQTASAHVAKQSKTLGGEVERFLAGIRAA